MSLYYSCAERGKIANTPVSIPKPHTPKSGKCLHLAVTVRQTCLDLSPKLTFKSYNSTLHS